MKGRTDIQCGRLRQALLALLRAGLWEREVDDTSSFPLSDEDWAELFVLSREQTVSGMVFQGVCRLPDGLMPPGDVLARWVAEADAIECRNRRTDQVLAGLGRWFRDGDLNPVLLKGQGVALLYETPLLRECGDVDLYFNNRRAFDAALRYVREAGLAVEHEADGGVFYRWQGVPVEHHRRLLDVHDPFLQRYVGGLELHYGYGEAVSPSVPAWRMTVPSPFLNLLSLDLHILKHALGRGVGLRQLCDLARVCFRQHGEVEAAEMKAACLRLGLAEWDRLLFAFLTGPLGMPSACLPYPAVAADVRPLLDIVWRGGNFGRYRAGLGKAEARGRKWRTACSFMGNVRFASRYAPREAFWSFAGLLKGQFWQS